MAKIKITVKEFFDKIAVMEKTVYRVDMVNQFKKSVDLSYARGFDLQSLYIVIEMLAQGNHCHPNIKHIP